MIPWRAWSSGTLNCNFLGGLLIASAFSFFCGKPLALVLLVNLVLRNLTWYCTSETDTRWKGDLTSTLGVICTWIEIIIIVKYFLYILCSWHAFHCHRHHAACSFSYSFAVKVLMLKMISVLSGILLEKTMCPWNLLRIHNSTVFVDCHNNFYMELLSIKY